jgi:enterochelin esterase-like enzyme
MNLKPTPRRLFLAFIGVMVCSGIIMVAYGQRRKKISFTVERIPALASEALGRDVVLEVYLPPGYAASSRRYGVLYLNDGQDAEALRLHHTLDSLYRQKRTESMLVVAIHAGDRLQEYGTASAPDYKRRGSKAGAYTAFVTEELVPFVNARFRTLTDPGQTAFAGFSLGGLSALDIVWHHPEIFGKVGVFSGALWWRAKSQEDGYTDADRIMHRLIRTGTKKEGLRFWFEAGTHDETSDRNHNGIIDAIEDTLDLIAELDRHGYSQPQAVTYLQVEGGEHNQKTWAKVMPDFLVWAFGRK